MKIHKGFLQGSEEWFALRRGRATASQFSRIITPAKAEFSKQAAGYMRDLLVECFAPDYARFLGNKWTDRGTEMEPEARKAFETHTGLTTEQVAFVTSERWQHVVGCSPDSLIRDAAGEYVAGLEIKCPSPFTHAEYIEAGTLPDEYKAQVHGGMAVTGLKRWHFFSHFPGLAPLHIIVERDDYTAKLTDALDRFIVEYGAYRERMTPKLQLEACRE
jgi:predicted phage-related endonuclease